MRKLLWALLIPMLFSCEKEVDPVEVEATFRIKESIYHPFGLMAPERKIIYHYDGDRLVKRSYVPFVAGKWAEESEAGVYYEYSGDQIFIQPKESKNDQSISEWKTTITLSNGQKVKEVTNHFDIESKDLEEVIVWEYQNNLPVKGYRLRAELLKGDNYYDMSLVKDTDVVVYNSYEGNQLVKQLHYSDLYGPHERNRPLMLVPYLQEIFKYEGDVTVTTRYVSPIFDDSYSFIEWGSNGVTQSKKSTFKDFGDEGRIHYSHIYDEDTGTWTSEEYMQTDVWYDDNYMYDKSESEWGIHEGKYEVGATNIELFQNYSWPQIKYE